MLKFLTVGLLLATASQAPASAQLLPTPPAYDMCAALARAIADPFVELDKPRCDAALSALKARDAGRYASLQNQVCPAVRGALPRGLPPSTGNDCAADFHDLRDTYGSVPTSDAVYRLIPGDQYAGLPTHCEFLASTYKRTELRDEKQCAAFEAERLGQTPAASIGDYRKYCASLKNGYPAVKNLSDNAHDLRLCGGITEEINKKRQVAGFTKEQATRIRNQDTASRLTGIIILALITPVACYFAFFWPKKKAQRAQQRYMDKLTRRCQQALSGAGNDPDTREDNIIYAYDLRDAILYYDEDSYQNGGLVSISFKISRSLAAMSPKEALAARISLMLLNRGLIDLEAFDNIRFGVIYGDGRATVENGDFKSHPSVNLTDFSGALALYAKLRAISAEGAVNLALSLLQRISAESPDHPTVRALRNLVMGGGSWLDERDIPTSAFKEHAGPSLLLGRLKTGTQPTLTYSGGGSLITIAPPGAGKTQCHVLPNLVMWPSSAIVLDVKGDLHPETCGWRERNVGPT